ncbi:hypothetical protein OG875_12780 [Streptomyces sp. NBC_01498]|uniref:hypothetical protein n=1 Tax=Streptomyces sp. NBC_01498 TaxID=2975870 RepID=UPI002E7C24D6|nr:hypothetical protein [Streptomyces sp. NBC_01498]WTL25387.1 hypothetical protein OG875_12780 [Streptomyces sp. NBC_01498]
MRGLTRAGGGRSTGSTGSGERRGRGGSESRGTGSGEDPGGPGRSIRVLRWMKPSATAATCGVALTALLVFGLFTVGGSSSATGVRDEGPATLTTVAPSPPPASGFVVVPAPDDALTLLRRDPAVNARLKTDLKPCARNAYPLDVSYGNLTGGTEPDVVINVRTCDDTVGLGTYVYRKAGARPYTNVFAADTPGVYATIDRDELVVTRQVYAWSDRVAYPSGEDIATYAWGGTTFTERYRVRNHFGSGGADGDDPLTVFPAPSVKTDG